MRSPLQSALCIFAHPDDETILAGGMIKMMTQQGIQVHVVNATRGEGGELGEPPVTLDRSQLGAIRETEVRKAMEALGATVSFLGYVDPVIGPDDILYPFEADPDILARQIAAVAHQHRARLILTHGAEGEYGHPAHVLVHDAVVKAVRHIYPDTLLYSVAANVPSVNDRLWNKGELAHFALDIRPWAQTKIAAMECHVSQHALFMRRRKLTNVADALRTVESVRRIWPTLEPGEPPEDNFAELLRTAGAWTPAPPKQS